MLPFGHKSNTQGHRTRTEGASTSAPLYDRQSQRKALFLGGKRSNNMNSLICSFQKSGTLTLPTKPNSRSKGIGLRGAGGGELTKGRLTGERHANLLMCVL